jgi:hypothetical protein
MAGTIAHHNEVMSTRIFPPDKSCAFPKGQNGRIRDREKAKKYPVPERTVQRSCFQTFALMILNTFEVEAAMTAPP